VEEEEEEEAKLNHHQPLLLPPRARQLPPKKKNMTWGGRPDPTPELNVAKDESFFAADWRFNKK
jgi:hypothetical protein